MSIVFIAIFSITGIMADNSRYSVNDRWILGWWMDNEWVFRQID